ncbi:hypothetical protein Pst134EB_018036 [Puccinia striiformis f. sp. tritici]|nr:hypothetical protein Pst134EB_018036 [Puccinia striiformis f. sp. tritici]
MCRTCLDAAAAHVNRSEVPAPTTLHNKSAAVKSKQNQACMRAKEMLAKTKATVNPPTTSTSKRPRSPERQVTSSSPAPPDDPYDKAQQKRMSVCAKRSSPKTNKQRSSKSKPSSSKKVAEKNPQPTKGVIPASPDSNNLTEVLCGFEVRIEGRFRPRLSAPQQGVFFDPKDPNSHSSLLVQLRKMFVGQKVSLGDAETLKFNRFHFPYTILGSKNVVVDDQKSFKTYLQKNKSVDLIFNHDAYADDHPKQKKKEHCDSDVESGSELESIDIEVLDKYQAGKKHGPPSSSPDISRVDQEDGDVGIQNSTKPPVDDVQTTTPYLSTIPSDCNANQSREVQALLLGSQITQRLPPWISNSVLNFSDLSWKRFGICDYSQVLSEQNVLGWQEGIRLELDPNGIDVFRRLVHYKLSDEVINQTDQDRVIKAELLNTPATFSMVAICHPTNSNINPLLSALPVPIFRMRTYAVARQFLALFANSIVTAPEATSDLKSLAKQLRIVEAFPMYQDEDDTGPFSPIQTGIIANLNQTSKPKKLFFLEEYIPGNWNTFLDEGRINLNLNDHSPAIDHLMEAFQHWTYNHTEGQIIVTNLKGVIPLLSKPKIMDIDPRAHWAQNSVLESRSHHADFISSHKCLRACRALGLKYVNDLTHRYINHY